MSIWFHKTSVAVLNERYAKNVGGVLAIEFTDWDESSLTARMPVTPRHHQPLGILHGGVSCVLAESVGSVAGNHCVDQRQSYCVGLEIQANHLKSVSDGYVTARAEPLHLGRSTQLWQIEIRNEHGQLTCHAKLTLMVKSRQG